MMPIAPTLLPPAEGPVCLALSGGLDSVSLLHALAGNAFVRDAGLRAVHVNHGLHADAERWTAHCRQLCSALGVDLDVAYVQVDAASGHGPEGAARLARHAALEARLAPGEFLALAHHIDDQAETFLLRALRGSGVDGLAAMRPLRRFGHGWMWRPWLGHTRAVIREYAQSHGLAWMEDPSNASDEADRNFLRHRVFPLLRARWPHASSRLARSAHLADEASVTLHEDDDRLLSAMLRDAHDGDALDIERLAPLPRPQRARILRLWVSRLGLPALPAHGVDAIERDLMPARDGRTALFAWRGSCIRRWSGRLHASQTDPPLPVFPSWWDGTAALASDTGDRLILHGAPALPVPVQVRMRVGGERIRLPRRTHSHALKHVLQDHRLPPWVRARMPLLFAADGELLAAGDILSARLHESLAPAAARLRWCPAGAAPSSIDD